MDYRKATIRISEIDIDDALFCITTRKDIEDLALSIRTAGLINPPLLMPVNTGRYRIVCGFRRIAACLENGFETIEANLVEETADRLDCIITAVADNAGQRELNWIEISRAINLLLEERSGPAGLTPLLSALGLPDNSDVVEKAARFIHLAAPIREGLISGHIPFAMALELGDLQPEAGSLLAQVFKDLSLSLNKQRDILLWAGEIAARESIRLYDLLMETGIQEILQNPESDRTQKHQSLRNILKRRRFPVIQEIERQYNDKCRLLKIPSGIRLIPPKDFETDRYAFQFEFTNVEQLAVKLKQLEQLSEKPLFRDLMTGLSPEKETGSLKPVHRVVK